MMHRFIILFCLFFLMTPVAFATQCVDVFPDGIQNNNNSGSITFNNNARLINSPDNILNSKNSIIDYSGGVSCDSGVCSSSGDISEAVAYPTPPNNNNNVTVPYAQTQTISAGNYNNITLNSSATLNLNSGDYFLSGSFTVGSSSKVNIIGSGVVRIFVKSTISFHNATEINLGGKATDLLLHADNNITFLSSSNTTAFVYSKKDVTLNSQAIVTGALSGENVTMGSPSTVNFISTEPDFGDFCGISLAQPITSYRFDETEYADIENEIIDSIGGFHGQAKGSQPIEGKVCNAIDLSATGTSDYAILNESILSGKTDFSISLWTKTAKTSNQSILSGAGASNNELLMWFINHTNFRPYLKNNHNGEISTPSIADDNWHHLVWVREGDQSCLFVDKVLQGCLTQTTLPLNIQSLILGQEQDSIGGGFVSSQAFDGLIDELLIFDGAISDSDIVTIYNNQDTGLNFDGTPRDCPLNPFPIPVLDLRFDEYDWTENNSILDSSGNDYHANAINVSPTLETEGAICRAADLTATGIDDYITLNSEALNNRSNFSISLWYKTLKTGPQSLISGANPSSFNELIYWFHNSTQFRPHIKGSGGAISVVSSSDGVWHHLVWTRAGATNRLYRDGVLLSGSASLPLGAVTISSLILGQEQDSLGGSFDPSQSVEGLIDELLVFDKVMTADQVATVYSNQDAGLNYDATVRDCPMPPVPILNMRMDESSWSGDLEEVIDETGNYHSQAINGATTAQSTPAIIGNPGTCGYGTFDGINDYVALPNAFENQQESFTITAWIRPSNTHAGSRIFADDEDNSKQGYAFSLGDPGSGKLRFYSRGVSPISVDTLNSVIATDTWTFVAAVHNSETKTREIYVNGVAQTVTGGGFSNTYTGNWGVDPGIATIGGESDSGETGNRFTGSIDEVRMYRGALTQAEIADVQNETHPCPSLIDHFEINHDGNGLTCEPESITINACADANCSTFFAGDVDVQLSINGNFDQSVSISGGTTDTTFSYIQTGIATLSLDQTYECNNGGTNSCDVTFTDAGFRFLYGTAESTTISPQISGNTFSDIVKLQAVENIDGVCTGLFTGNVDVELSQQNVDPVGVSGKNLTLNSTPIGKYPTFTPNITLNFGADSKAIIPSLTYLDAGQIRLHANYDDAGVSLTGNSNDFWVSPHQLVVTASSGGNNINGNNINATVTHKAGQPFDFTVTAYNSLGTGVANITENYSPNDIQLFLTRTGPSTGGFDGDFNYGTGFITSALTPTPQSVTLTVFSGGTSSTNSANYSEVGLLNLEVQDMNYGYSGNIITANAIDIGRFTPDHFSQTVVAQGSFDSVCNQNTPFAYVGQTLVDDNAVGAISYLVNPVVELTANNSSGSPTKNYTEAGFMKLTPAANFIVAPSTDSTMTGKDTLLLPLTSNMFAGTVSHNGLVAGLPSFGVPLEDGVLHYELAGADNFFYPRNENAEVIAQESDIDFVIDQGNFIDSDGIAIISPVDITLTAGINIRFGRAYLENSFGPETSQLPQTFLIEYLNASNNYVINDQDSCINIDSTNITITSGSLNKDLTSVNSITSPVLTGVSRAMILSAPGAGNQGSVNIEYDIYDWLKYDWDWNGVDAKVLDENPSAIATFGLFRGNDRIIYQREVN